MKVAGSLILALLIQFAASMPAVNAQPSCRFVLGFATLRDLIGAQKVGQCLEDEHFNLENGNSEQQTSGGLMVWRKVDNFTAFTDGATSWINGPNGLQSRPNRDRFSWEKDPVRPSAATEPASVQVAAPGAAASQRPTGEATATLTPTPTPAPRIVPTFTPTPSPVPTQETGPDPALMSKCVTSASDMAEEFNQDLPPGSSAGGRAFQALLGICQTAVRDHGQRGFTCFDTAFRRGLRLNRVVRPGSSSAADAALAEYKLCVSAR